MNRENIYVFTLAYAILTFYGIGAGFLNHFVTYRSWEDVGKYVSNTDFPKWHSETSKNIIRVFVIPMAIRTVLTISLFWFRPASIPVPFVWMVLGCQVVEWASSAFIQIPAQIHLSTVGYSKELIERIISTDWIRKAGLLIEAVVILKTINMLIIRHKI
jgi:hypothetical protein